MSVSWKSSLSFQMFTGSWEMPDQCWPHDTKITHYKRACPVWVIWPVNKQQINCCVRWDALLQSGGLTKLGSFLLMSLIQAPESHQTPPRGWAQSAYWVLCSPWKGTTYNHNPCFLPLGSCCNMGKYTFLIVVTPLVLPDFHSLHPLVGLPCTKVHNFCAEAPHWASEVGEEWFCLHQSMDYTPFTPSFTTTIFLLEDGHRIPLILHYFWWLLLSHGGQSLVPPVYCLFWCSKTP